MSGNIVLAAFYNQLPDNEMLINLIAYIKKDTNNEHYNSDYARELISKNIIDFFERTTLLQQFPTSQMSQSNLLFDFSQWVHMTVDKKIKNESNTNYVI